MNEAQLDRILNGKRRSLKEILPRMLQFAALAATLAFLVALATATEERVPLGGSIGISLSLAFSTYKYWNPKERKIVKGLLCLGVYLLATGFGWYLATLL
ncbi:MAG: hypothetical protein ACOZAO_00780 [Patescibacteria group bacterium]